MTGCTQHRIFNMVADEYVLSIGILINFSNKFKLAKHGMPPHRKSVSR